METINVFFPTCWTILLHWFFCEISFQTPVHSETYFYGLPLVISRISSSISYLHHSHNGTSSLLSLLVRVFLSKKCSYYTSVRCWPVRLLDSWQKRQDQKTVRITFSISWYVKVSSSDCSVKLPTIEKDLRSEENT